MEDYLDEYKIKEMSEFADIFREVLLSEPSDHEKEDWVKAIGLPELFQTYERMPNGMTVMYPEDAEKFFLKFGNNNARGMIFGRVLDDALPEDFTTVSIRTIRPKLIFDYPALKKYETDKIIIGVPLLNTRLLRNYFFREIYNLNLRELITLSRRFSGLFFLSDFADMMIYLNAGTKLEYEDKLTQMLRHKILKTIGIYELI